MKTKIILLFMLLASASAQAEVVTLGAPIPTGTNVIGGVYQSAGPWTTKDTSDGAVSGGAPGTSSLLAGGIYNSSPLTLTNGQQSSLQLDANGYLFVDIAAGGTSGTSGGGGTVVQGNHGTNAQAWWMQVGDGTNGPVAVKAASTASVATDPSFVVALSPNSPLPSGSNALGSVSVTGTVAISASALPLPTGAATSAIQTNGTQETEINNGGTVAAVKAASTAAAAVDPALVVSLSPNSPLPTGSNALGSVTVTGTTTISGTVAEGNTGSNAQAWWVQIGDATHGPAAVKAASTAAIATDPALVVAVSPNNSVAITAASLPLPTGAAQDSTLTGGTQKTEINNGASVVAVKAASTSAAAVDPSFVVALSPNSPLPTGSNALGSVTVTGTTTISGTVAEGNTGSNAQAWWVQIGDATHGPAAVKAASTAAIATDPALVVAVSPNNSVAVTSTQLPAALDGSGFLKTHEQGTATISGTVTANAGSNLNTSALALDATLTGGTQKTEINNGATVAAVKAASTAAIATDPALVIAVSPNNTVAVSSVQLPAALDGSGFLKTHEQGTASVSGTVTANAGSNLNTSALALDATLTGGTQKVEINNGATVTAVKAASTAAVAADPALVVAVSPNNTLIVDPATLTNEISAGGSVTGGANYTDSSPMAGATSVTLWSVLSSITGSPSGCNIQVQSSFNGGSNYASQGFVIINSWGPATSFYYGPPSQGASAGPLGDHVKYSFTCSVYPTTGTWNLYAVYSTGTLPVAVKNASTAAVVSDNAMVVTVSPNTATMPISAASLPLPTGAAQDSTLTGGTQKVEINNGATVAAVKAASTAAVAADPALVVAISPNNSIAVSNMTLSGFPVKALNAISTGATCSSAITNTGLDSVNLSWTTTGAPTNVVLYVEGSADNATYYECGNSTNSTFTSGYMTVTCALPFLKACTQTFSGGSSPTVTAWLSGSAAPATGDILNSFYNTPVSTGNNAQVVALSPLSANIGFQGTAAPAYNSLGGSVYNSTAQSVTTGQSISNQADVNGLLRVTQGGWARYQASAISLGGTTAAAQTIICGLWNPATSTVQAEIEKIYFNTTFNGTQSGGVGSTTLQLVRLTALTPANCTAVTSVKSNQSSSAVGATVYNTCSPQPSFGAVNAFEDNQAYTTTAPTWGSHSPPTNLLWDDRDTKGLQLTARAGVGEGWAVTTSNSSAFSSADHFACTIVWTEH